MALGLCLWVTEDEDEIGGDRGVMGVVKCEEMDGFAWDQYLRSQLDVSRHLVVVVVVVVIELLMGEKVSRDMT